MLGIPDKTSQLKLRQSRHLAIGQSFDRRMIPRYVDQTSCLEAGRLLPNKLKIFYRLKVGLRQSGAGPVIAFSEAYVGSPIQVRSTKNSGGNGRLGNSP